MKIFAYIVLLAPTLASFAVAAVLDPNAAKPGCHSNAVCPPGYCCNLHNGVRFFVWTLVPFNMFTCLLSDRAVSSFLVANNEKFGSGLSMGSMEGK